MPTLLSLFDYSGNWSRPYAEAGWNVIQWDIKHECDKYSKFSDIMDACAEFIYEHIFENYGTVEGVIAAPDCTHFANSGAQYWKIKDEDGRTAIAMEYVSQVLRIVDLCKPYFWVIENPVGRLSKLFPELGKPHYFNPCDYAGYYTNSDDEHLIELMRQKPLGDVSKEELELIKKAGIYTKKTGLWGNFTIPEIKYIEPIRTSKQGSWLQSLGGKSKKTKEERSNTPLGFSYAFYQANNTFDHIEDEDEFFDLYVVETEYRLQNSKPEKVQETQLSLWEEMKEVI